MYRHVVLLAVLVAAATAAPDAPSAGPKSAKPKSTGLCQASVQAQSGKLISITPDACKDDKAVGSPTECLNALTINVTRSSGPPGCTAAALMDFAPTKKSCADVGGLGIGSLKPTESGGLKGKGRWAKYWFTGRFNHTVDSKGTLEIKTSLKDGTECTIRYATKDEGEPYAFPADEAQAVAAYLKREEVVSRIREQVADVEPPSTANQPAKSAAGGVGVSSTMFAIVLCVAAVLAL